MNNSWSWFWRFKQTVFGGPRAVNLEATIISFPQNAELNRTNLDLGEATYVATNGVRVWILPEPELKRLSGAFLISPGVEALARPRISTADAIEALLFSGQTLVLGGVTNSVGVSFGCYPHVRQQVTDLTTTLLVSEALTNGTTVNVLTNLDLTARVQLQRGSGFFLLDSSGEKANGKPIGVIVTARVPKKK